MQIQVNTDDHIQGREDVVRTVETEINNAIGRFSDQITRIEVHLSDVNAGKGGGNDKHCAIEARLAGRRPEAVTAEGPTLKLALNGATKKLKRMLENTLGRLDDRKGGASIRVMEQD